VVEGVHPMQSGLEEFYPLTSLAKGDLPVMPDRRKGLILLESYYRVDIRLDTPMSFLKLGRTGAVFADSRPRSRLADMLRHVYNVILRESSF
jgi:hypothetical protein